VVNWGEDQGHIWRNHVRAVHAAKALHGRLAADATSSAASAA
jgi:hypothetical protein